eukprot:6188276-Pleurochrysis_carterae.AAC.4
MHPDRMKVSLTPESENNFIDKTWAHNGVVIFLELKNQNAPQKCLRLVQYVLQRDSLMQKNFSMSVYQGMAAACFVLYRIVWRDYPPDIVCMVQARSEPRFRAAPAL